MPPQALTTPQVKITLVQYYPFFFKNSFLKFEFPPNLIIRFVFLSHLISIVFCNDVLVIPMQIVKVMSLLLPLSMILVMEKVHTIGPVFVLLPQIVILNFVVVFFKYFFLQTAFVFFSASSSTYTVFLKISILWFFFMKIRSSRIFFVDFSSNLFFLFLIHLLRSSSNMTMSVYVCVC